MFTGIITHLGKIDHQKNSHIFISCKTLPQLTKGQSIAVNGVCLTIIQLNAKSFTVEIMDETYRKTTLSSVKKGDLVNLELPLTPTSFLSGHIVQGHVDGVGTLKKITREGNSIILTVSYPKDLKKYIVNKGSIAINGVSLTVIEISNNHITLGIIPYTWKHTMFHTLKVSDQLNLEVDILAKYICQKI